MGFIQHVNSLSMSVRYLVSLRITNSIRQHDRVICGNTPPRSSSSGQTRISALSPGFWTRYPPPLSAHNHVLYSQRHRGTHWKIWKIYVFLYDLSPFSGGARSPRVYGIWSRLTPRPVSEQMTAGVVTLKKNYSCNICSQSRGRNNCIQGSSIGPNFRVLISTSWG